MGVFSDRLHIAENCGRLDRVIRLADLHTIEIGCFRGTKAEAIAAIRRKYEGQEADDYIQKVRECFEGTDDPDKIRRYATHPYWRIRAEVARQGFELELLKKDREARVQIQARRAQRKIEAIAEIWKKYEGQEADDYIQKVRECFEGTDDPDRIRHYATHPYWRIRAEVARQGFELELLKKDTNYSVRRAAELVYQKLEKQQHERMIESEKDLERSLCARMKALGGECIKLSSDYRRGMPDRLCIFPGWVVFLVEVKGTKGRVSKAQRRTIEELSSVEGAAGMVRVVKSSEDIDTLIHDALVLSYEKLSDGG